MRTVTRARLALLSASLLGACGADFQEPELVTKLRVLAVQVEPPDAAPGDLVTVRPLVADPRGDGREVTIDYALCLRPDADAVSSPLTPDECARAADEGELVAVGSGEETMIPVPAELRPALEAAELESFPIYVRVLVRAGEDRVVALATVLATLASERNANPVIERVTVAGETLEDGGATLLGAVDEAELAATLDAGSEEEYTVHFPATGRSEEREETLRLAWFTTAGKLDPPAVSLEEPSTKLEDFFAEDDAVEVFLVVTDGRGGVDTWSATLTRE